MVRRSGQNPASRNSPCKKQSCSGFHSLVNKPLPQVVVFTHFCNQWRIGREKDRLKEGKQDWHNCSCVLSSPTGFWPVYLLFHFLLFEDFIQMFFTSCFPLQEAGPGISRLCSLPTFQLWRQVLLPCCFSLSCISQEMEKATEVGMHSSFLIPASSRWFYYNMNARSKAQSQFRCFCLFLKCYILGILLYTIGLFCRCRVLSGNTETVVMLEESSTDIMSSG